MTNGVLKGSLTAGFALLAILTMGPAVADDAMFGFIGSIRGNILEIRPPYWLDHKWTRIAIETGTVVYSATPATIDQLKPGQRILVSGSYSAEQGFHPWQITYAKTRIGSMAERSHGLTLNAKQHTARCLGTLKRVRPFVVTDDAGHDHGGNLDALDSVYRLQMVHRNDILIGTEVFVTGSKAPDGVIRATSVSWVNDRAVAGAMFGAVTGVNGRRLTVNPRFTADTISVVRKPQCAILRQVNVDPDSIKVGDEVTFSGNLIGHGSGPGELYANTLLIGSQHYPHVAQGTARDVFVTGRLTSLNPARLKLANGKLIDVNVPLQMPIATLKTLSAADIKPGERGMFILSRNPGGGFATKTIVLDASPWVGYGGGTSGLGTADIARPDFNFWY